MTGLVRGCGALAAFALDAVGVTLRRRLAWRELLAGVWFVAGATAVPAVAVAAALGAVTGAHARAVTGALGVPSEPVLDHLAAVAPLVTALVVAVAGGSALCAELAARTSSDQLVALAAIGIDPVQRLAVPAVLAVGVVTALLNGVVTVVAAAAWGLLQPTATGLLNGVTLAAAGQALALGIVLGLVAVWHGFTAGARAETGVSPGRAVGRAVAGGAVAVLAAQALLIAVREAW